MKRRDKSKHHLVKNLLPDCTFSSPTRIGRFTIIQAFYGSNGRVVCGIGQARKTDIDIEDEEIALNRAKTRAVGAIVDKLKNKEPRHPLTG